MKKVLIAFLLLSACFAPEEPQEDRNATAPVGQPQAGSGAPRAPGAVASLAGFYEGGGTPKHQMCIVDGSGDQQRFGLVVWGQGSHSCSGSGAVTRDGDKLRLAMAGDSACTLEATISGKTVKLPERVPEGCSYYCGARAGLNGVELTQTGTTQASAMRAKDLVGESLCGSEQG